MDKTIPFSLHSLRLLRVQVCNLNPTFPRSESRTGYIVDFAFPLSHPPEGDRGRSLLSKVETHSSASLPLWVRLTKTPGLFY